MLIVPGIMADATTWRPVADAIDLPNPIVIVNRRGRKPSGSLGPRYSVDTEIADLRRIIDALGGRVHLVGWSFGALISLETALIQRGILSVTAYEPVGSPFAPEAVGPLREAVSRRDFDRAVEIVNTVVSGFSSAYVENLRRTPVWKTLCALAEPVAEELRAINQFRPAFDRYGDIRVPVSLILGDINDGRPPYGTAFDAFARALPQSPVLRLAGQGHLAHAQAPEALAHAITSAVETAADDCAAAT